MKSPMCSAPWLSLERTIGMLYLRQQRRISRLFDSGVAAVAVRCERSFVNFEDHTEFFCCNGKCLIICRKMRIVTMSEDFHTRMSSLHSDKHSYFLSQNHSYNSARACSQSRNPVCQEVHHLNLHVHRHQGYSAQPQTTIQSQTASWENKKDF